MNNAANIATTIPADHSAFFFVDGIPTKGAWIDLDFADGWDDVKEALADANIIPRDEDGEPNYGGDILAADGEGLAAEFIGTASIFDLEGFVECRDADGNDDAKIAYIELFGDFETKRFEEAYQGKFNSELDFVYDFIDSTGYLDSVPEHAQNYFDYESFRRDLFMSDYCESGGHVFSNY